MSARFGSEGADFMGGVAEGVVSLHTRRALGFDDPVNYGQIFADAFGNALAGSLYRGFQLKRAENRIPQILPAELSREIEQIMLATPTNELTASVPGHQDSLSTDSPVSWQRSGKSDLEWTLYQEATIYAATPDWLREQERELKSRQILIEEYAESGGDASEYRRALNADIANWQANRDAAVEHLFADEPSAHVNIYVGPVPSPEPPISEVRFGEEFYGSWNNFVDSSPFLRESIGIQSAPTTTNTALQALTAGMVGGKGSISGVMSTNAQMSLYGYSRSAFSVPNTWNTMIVNQNASANRPMVTSIATNGRAPTIPAGAVLRSGLSEGAKSAPLLSFAGTSLQYGLANYYGEGVNPGGDTARDFAVDAGLDVSKSIVSGAAGAAVGAAATGALVGSVVPVVGTAIGFGVGLAVGITVSIAIEHGFTWAGSRDALKGR